MNISKDESKALVRLIQHHIANAMRYRFQQVGISEAVAICLKNEIAAGNWAPHVDRFFDLMGEGKRKENGDLFGGVNIVPADLLKSKGGK